MLTIMNVPTSATNLENNDLTLLSDEFDNPETLKNWTFFHDKERWPNRIEKIGINKKGLFIIPRIGCWVGDLQGIYLYKNITSDFIATTRVYVNGKSKKKSDNDWAISGLMARTAKETTRENWTQNQENWVYLMHGKSPGRGVVIDSKSNINSKWEAELSKSENGVELKMVRLGSLIINLRRFPDGQWKVLDRFVRKDMPTTLQVGLNMSVCNKLYEISDFNFNSRTTFSKNEQADSITHFDYIHFERPKYPKRTMTKMSDTELLAFLGD